jgi:ribosome-associated protein
MMPVLQATSKSSRTTVPDRRAAVARAREQAIACARACDDSRGKETLVLDVSKITPLFDFFVITTGTSPRQMRAIAERADDAMVEHGSARRSIEGYDSGTWIVQDYGDVVLHVFNPESRALYDLANLWGDAPQVEWTTN